MQYYICLIAGILAVVAFLSVRVKKSGLSAAILKALASLFFIFTALSAVLFKALPSIFALGRAELGMQRVIYALFITAGLVCGLLGDIFLDFKFVYPNDDATHTFTGFASFAVGHCFFIAALTYAFDVKLNYLLIAAAISVVAGFAIYFSEKLLHLSYGRFKLISALYAALLFFVCMYAGAISLSLQTNTAAIVVFIGMVCFVISDLILSNTYFGKNMDGPIFIISNHVFYYAAQFIIASSILFI